MRPEHRASTLMRSGVPESVLVDDQRDSSRSTTRTRFVLRTALFSQTRLGRNPRIESAITTHARSTRTAVHAQAAEKNPRAREHEERVRARGARSLPKPFAQRLASLGGASRHRVRGSVVGDECSRMDAAYARGASVLDFVARLRGRFGRRTERGIVPVTPGDGWLVFGYGS